MLLLFHDKEEINPQQKAVCLVFGVLPILVITHLKTHFWTLNSLVAKGIQKS